MAINTDYPSPVMVNGFSCKNCTDVDYAKKHIDPAHPKSGPYGIDAKDDPTVRKDDTVRIAGVQQAAPSPTTTRAPDAASGPGQQIDVTA